MAHLIEQGVPPESILLLTFTRRAAQEMLWRAGQISSQACRQVMGGTFHATSNLLLRRHGHHLGFAPGFTIIDRGDAEGIINLIKSSLGLAGAGKRFPSKRMIVNILSGAVNKSRAIEDLVYEQHLHLAEFLDDLHRIQEHYARFKTDHGLMDYDDLLVNWHRLLSESPEARREVTSRFSHILVDEYQDTNQMQAGLSGCSPMSTTTSWRWATTPSPSTASAAPISTTSCASPSSFPAPGSSSWRRTTAPPSRSSP